MNTIDYYVAAAFSIVILVIGLLFSRSGGSLKGFFAAGGNVPWWINGLSLFMSFFSVGTFVVWGSIAYTSGLVAVTIQTTMAFAGVIIALFIAPAWNKTKVLTAADFISKRLGKKLQKAYSSAFLFINLFTAGAFLYPVGKIIQVSAGIDLNIAIIGLGLFIIAYTTVGGLWAVLVTDVLQFVVLTAAVIIIVPLSFTEVGGVSSFISKLPEGFAAVYNDEYGLLFLFAFLIYNIVFIGGNWAYVQRYTSVSSPRNAKKVGWLFASLYLIAPVIWMIPPIAYRIVNPDLAGTQAEEAYLLMGKLVVPDGLLGLILGAMIFATASSVNTTINIASGVFTNDIVKSLKPHLNTRKLMQVARLSTFTFGLMAIAVALSVQNMGGIVEVVLSIAALTGVPLYLPPIWAMFSTRQTSFSILVSTILSLAINAFFKFVSPSLIGFQLDRAWEMMVGVCTPILILGLFEMYYFLTKSVSKEHVRYVELCKSSTSPQSQFEPQENTENTDDNQFGLNILMYGIAVIGVMITGLGLITNTATFETVAVGLVVITLSTFMLIARKGQR